MPIPVTLQMCHCVMTRSVKNRPQYLKIFLKLLGPQQRIESYLTCKNYHETEYGILKTVCPTATLLATLFAKEIEGSLPKPQFASIVSMALLAVVKGNRI